MPEPEETHANRLRRMEHLALALVNEAASGSSPGLLDPDIDMLLDRLEGLVDRLRASRGGP